MDPYPDTGPARDRYVLDRRSGVPAHDPWVAQGLDVEDEGQPDGTLSRTATVFLTGRECPWRCAMCDLWRSTTAADTPHGAIPSQVAWACEELKRRGEAISQFKLYNAGNFFDPRAVPPADYSETARLLAGSARVIVEAHPALIGQAVDRLLEALAHSSLAPGPALEVAMGLETAHAEALASLNKRMTLDDFRSAAAFLATRGVPVRAFLLVHPPFISSAEQDTWLLRSIDEALAAGASVVSLIPTRPGNGALEALAGEGRFTAPRLVDAERALAAGLARANGRGRVFLDLWDLARLASCASCFDDRRDRLRTMNRLQRVLPVLHCPSCPGSAA